MKKVKERLEIIRSYLVLANEQIEKISREDRTDETDVLLNRVADAIYEAQQSLDRIDKSPYEIRYVGEQIKIMRHRKPKV